jgi:IS5 family transposase
MPSDAIFALLCACGHNLRKILARLRAVLALFIAAILNAIWQRPDHQIRPDAA